MFLETALFRGWEAGVGTPGPTLICPARPEFLGLLSLPSQFLGVVSPNCPWQQDGPPDDILSVSPPLLGNWFCLCPALDGVGDSHTYLLIPPLIQGDPWSPGTRFLQPLLTQTALAEGPTGTPGNLFTRGLTLGQ